MGKTKKRGGKNEKTDQERQQNTQKRPKNDENLKKVVCSIRKVICYQWSTDRCNHERKIFTKTVQLSEPKSTKRFLGRTTSFMSAPATRPITRIPDIWKSPQSHPQLPIDSLQPWSKDSFNFFIFIYLVDALWGQHLYMYKVRLQK